MSLKSKVRNGSQKTAHLDCIGHTYKAKVLSTHVQPMYPLEIDPLKTENLGLL